MVSTRARKGWLGRIMALEPLVTRGTIVAILGVVGMILNMQFAEGTVETVVNIALAAFGLLTAIISRPAVIPAVKVERYDPNPFQPPRTIYGEK